MSFELIGSIILTILGLLTVSSVTFKIIDNSKKKKNSQKIKGNNNIQAGGDITIAETLNQYYQNEAIPKIFLTSHPKKVRKKQFIARDRQVAKLKAKIRSGENLACISGFGGVGKTTIARTLYHKLKTKYKYIAWIDYNGSLKESILNQVYLFFGEKDREVRWRQIKAFITECENSLLLFIDNFSYKLDSDFEWLAGLNAHLFITSRFSEVDNFEAYEISFLDNSEGIKVFYCYYKHDKRKKQKETVSQLVDLVSCHTLSIELLAGIANSIRYRCKLAQFLQDLRDSGFGFSNLKVTSFHRYEGLTISEHLVKLFDIAPFNEKQLHILANFQIIPKGFQVPRGFSEWIGSDETTLEGLATTRWISFSDDTLVMYDIVWEAVQLQLKKLFPHGILYEYAEKMMETIVSEDYFNETEEHLLSTKKVQIAEAYAIYFSDRGTLEWSDFLNLLGLKYQNKGEYDKALEFHEKALGICEKILEKDHPHTAITYNNFGLVYSRKGEFDKARIYYERALPVFEKVFGEDDSDCEEIRKNLTSLSQH